MSRDLSGIPAPVRRYLERAGMGPRPAVHLEQCGELRTAPGARRWMQFTATHEARGDRPQFVWRARVRLAPALPLTVVDRLQHGIGSGEVRLLGLRVGSAHGGPAMNAGSLHRYLAEAVWYPQALWPSERLAWSPHGQRSAVATLSEAGISVSLEFRFDAAGDVAAIHAPARWGKFGREYRQLPWEGHFGGYEVLEGVRVPREAEVGWHDGGRLEIVWKGHVEAFAHDTGRP